MKALIKKIHDYPKKKQGTIYRSLGRKKDSMKFVPESLKGQLVICKIKKTSLTLNKQYEVMNHYCWLAKEECWSKETPKGIVMYFDWVFLQYIEIVTDKGKTEYVRLSRFKVALNV
jgi:hypothetical protein